MERTKEQLETTKAKALAQVTRGNTPVITTGSVNPRCPPLAPSAFPFTSLV